MIKSEKVHKHTLVDNYEMMFYGIMSNCLSTVGK